MATKLACSTACFRHAWIDAALEEIRRAGFDAIDLSLIPGLGDHFDAAGQPASERQDFVALIRGSQLLVPTVTAAPGDFSFSSDRFEFILQSAVAHLKLAAQLACEALNVACAGPENGFSGRFEAEATARAKGLKRIAQEAAQWGLVLNLWMPDCRGVRPSLDEARFLLEQIHEDNARLVLDVAQLQSAGVLPAEAARVWAGSIGHVRVRDCADADLPALFEELERAGYDGYCALEPDIGEGAAEAGQRLSHSLRLIRTRLAAPVSSSAGRQ